MIQIEEIWPGSLKKASDAKFTSDNFENDTKKIVGSSQAFQISSHTFANASENSKWTLPHPVLAVMPAIPLISTVSTSLR